MMSKLVSQFSFLIVFSLFSQFALADIEPQVIRKKALIIATGLPGAGKTTYLKELSKIVLNSVYVDKDSISEIFQGTENNESEFYKKHVQRQTYDLMVKLGEDNLLADRIIILDSYFGNKLFTPLLSAYIKKNDGEKSKPSATPYVIYFICDDAEENHRRIVKRNAIQRDSDKFDPKQFARYRQERLLEHEKAFATLRSKAYSHIPFLTIHTDKDSPADQENNLKKILEFLKK